MQTRFIIFARVHIGPPINRWADNPSVMLGSEADLIDALIAGQIEGAIDRIEAYDIGDIARDISEDIARALGGPVRQRIEDGYRLSNELRDFIESSSGLDTVIPAKRFEPAREYAP